MGAFSIMRKDGEVPRKEYEEFVMYAKPELIKSHLEDKSYPHWYQSHLQNSTYLRFVQQALVERHSN